MSRIEEIVALYREEYKGLRAIAYSILNNANDADDVMQTVMVKLLEKEDLDSVVLAPKAFLRTCIRNEAISLWRRKKNAAVPVGEYIQEKAPPFHEKEYDKLEGLIYIKAYIRDLQPEIQAAFISYVLDGAKIVDLARGLKMKPDTLEKRFRQIKSQIRRRPGSQFTLIFSIIR